MSYDNLGSVNYRLLLADEALVPSSLQATSIRPGRKDRIRSRIPSKTLGKTDRQVRVQASCYDDRLPQKHQKDCVVSQYLPESLPLLALSYM